jgi:hypothetical protein
MSAIAAFPQCPNLQASLTTAWEKGALPAPHIPFLNFLLSNINTANVLQTMQSPGASKLRTVELTYMQRIAEADVSNTINFTCTGGSEQGLCSETYSIDETAGVFLSRSIDPLEISKICDSGEMYYATLLGEMFSACVREMETRAILGASLLTGKFATNDTDGVNGARTLKTVQFVDGAGDFDLDAYKEMIFSAQQAQYPSIPYVFGANGTTKYMTEVAAGCCATDGIDIAAFAAQNQLVYFDTLGKVEDQWGANEWFMTAAGAMQVIWHNRFVGFAPMNISSDDFRSMGVLVDPVTGIPFDVRITENCGTLTIEVALATDIVGLPTDIFPTGDRLDGVTYVNNFTI